MSQTHQMTAAVLGLDGFSLSRFLGKASTAIQRYAPALTSIAAGVGVQIPGIVAQGANLMQNVGQQFVAQGTTLPGAGGMPQSAPAGRVDTGGPVSPLRDAGVLVPLAIAGVVGFLLFRRRR